MSPLPRDADTYEMIERVLEALHDYFEEEGPKDRRKGRRDLSAKERKRLLRRINAILDIPEGEEGEEEAPEDGRSRAGEAQPPEHPGEHEREDKLIKVLKEIRDRLGKHRE